MANDMFKFKIDPNLGDVHFLWYLIMAAIQYGWQHVPVKDLLKFRSVRFLL